MRASTILAILALPLALPSAADAQDMSAICASFVAPEHGMWSDFAARTGDGDGSIRFAMLPGGDHGMRLELSVSDGRQDAIFQVDVPSFPFESAEISRIVMKADGRPAMVLPRQMIAMMSGSLDEVSSGINDCVNSEYLGTDSVDVGGVSYDAHHVRPAGQQEIEVWFSPDVPFGLVKATGDSGSMTLRDFGDGAVSSITETPMAMPGF